MFKKDTMVAWATKRNTYMGQVESSNERNSTILVTSTARRSKDIGRKFVVSNAHLGDISSGRTVVNRIQN